jgi:CRP/FNR family cyclic AMP-dependent transcriptional regulator
VKGDRVETGPKAPSGPLGTPSRPTQGSWYLQETDFSARVGAEDMAFFMRICPEHRYRQGEAIFHDGDRASHLHIIASGQVKLTVPTAKGQERILAVLGRDDFLGETFVRQAQRYRGDAIALTDVITCPMSRAQFLHLTLHAPDFVLAFAGILASGVLECQDHLGRSFDPVRVRVAKALCDQARRFGAREEESEWWRLETSLRHEEIAAMVSATRVATTMAIGELRELGFVEGTRGCYRLNLSRLWELEQGG